MCMCIAFCKSADFIKISAHQYFPRSSLTGSKKGKNLIHFFEKWANNKYWRVRYDDDIIATATAAVVVIVIVIVIVIVVVVDIDIVIVIVIVIDIDIVIVIITSSSLTLRWLSQQCIVL